MDAAAVGGAGPGSGPVGSEVAQRTAHEPAVDLGQALTRLMRAVSRAKDLVQSEGGRPEVATFPLLVALTDAGSMRSSDLAAAVMSDRSTVSRQVAHLVDLGYVERRPDPDDRRAFHLALTDAGTRALDQRRRARDDHLAHLTRDWPEDDRRTLARLVDRLAGELTHELRQRGHDQRVTPRRPTHAQEGP
jgi:DNA-binding MarR family transcriptional regulator